MSARWFYNAPVSKVLFYATAVSSLVAIRNNPSEKTFDINKILGGGEIWRLFVYQIPFQSSSELIFGLSFLYELRKFERMMGVPKFSVFMMFVTSLSTTLLASLNTILQLNVASGPYSIIYSAIVLHHVFIPVVKPRIMRVLGVDFSDKAFLYLMAFPLLLSNGFGSLFPAVCGVVSGSLYTSNIGGVQSWKFPKSIETFIKSVSRHIAGSPPPPQPLVARRPEGGVGNQAAHMLDDRMNNMRQAQRVPPVVPVAPPSEEDILNLMGMGFDRDDVIAALTSSGNSVQIAADRLLSS